MLLAITGRLSAEASEAFVPGGAVSFGAGLSVCAGLSDITSKPPFQQKGIKKRSAARRQSRLAHQKRDRHLAKVVKRGIGRKGLSGRPATTVLPASFDETEDRHLSAEFERHKGQLAWPLSGTVSMSFGLHGYMGRVQHNNVGITVDAPEGTIVKAVYQGEVTALEEIGDVWCVIMRHGRYYSAYSNLASTTVVKGQHVSVGETLGNVGDTGQLEFLLMHDNGEYVDPEKWLRK